MMLQGISALRLQGSGHFLKKILGIITDFLGILGIKKI